MQLHSLLSFSFKIIGMKKSEKKKKKKCVLLSIFRVILTPHLVYLLECVCVCVCTCTRACVCV